MYPPVATNDPTAVEVEVQKVYLAMFPNGNRLFVSRAFGWVMECFTGHYPDYQAVDTRYHDFEHTLQGTLCLARLLHGRHHAAGQPALTQQLFELAIIAILLHDTGYLKKRDDLEGTGAKYTATHVSRSAQFAARLLGEKGYSAVDITAVQNMIRCTGVDALLSSIPFQDELEKILGHALGTADLLGQMAADDYVDKLPILYAEFAEAARFDKGHTDFISKFGGPDDLMQQTPDFWQGFVLPRLEREFGGLHRYLNHPYPGGPNEYVQRVQSNIERIRQRLAVSD
jgi:hypothetical protein